MNVTYNTPNGRMSVEFQVDTQVDLFQQLAFFQEVFGEAGCGKCGSENLRFQVRNIEDNHYYELRCLDCGAKLAFGQGRQLASRQRMGQVEQGDPEGRVADLALSKLKEKARMKIRAFSILLLPKQR